MAQISVRNLPDEVVARLKERARLHGRSLEGEIRALLVREAGLSRADFWRVADEVAASLEPGSQTDSTRLIREDRDR